MRIVTKWLGLFRRLGKQAGPYLLLELLLPGGTLVALLLFMCQRKRPDMARNVQQALLVVTRMLAGVFEPRILVPVPVRACTRAATSGPTERP